MTDKSKTVEKRLALDIQRVCTEGGLCPRDTLIYLLSLWIRRLTYSGPRGELLVVDAEFGYGDIVVIHLKPVNDLKADPDFLSQSIAEWLRWSGGRDGYLTQVYGFPTY